MSDEEQLSREIQNPETPFFPPILSDIFSGNVPLYKECPNSINTASTQFSTFLIDFRSETDSRLIRNLLKGEELGKRAGRTLEGIAELIKDLSRREYGQDIYNINGNPVPGEIRTGNLSSIKGDESKIDVVSASIHTHPSGQTFSPEDWAVIFAGMDVHTLLGEPSKFDRYPTLRLQMISTTEGYFISFPTQETKVPTKEEAESDGIVVRWDKNKDRDFYDEIWKELLEKYGKERLARFIGEKIEYNTYFPGEVNDLGKNLINMHRMLKLGEKYKIPIYYTAKDKEEFVRINSVEDYFSDLAAA